MIGPIFKQFESIAFENPSLNMEPGRKGVTLGGFLSLLLGAVTIALSETVCLYYYVTEYIVCNAEMPRELCTRNIFQLN